MIRYCTRKPHDTRAAPSAGADATPSERRGARAATPATIDFAASFGGARNASDESLEAFLASLDGDASPARARGDEAATALTASESALLACLEDTARDDEAASDSSGTPTAARTPTTADTSAFLDWLNAADADDAPPPPPPSAPAPATTAAPDPPARAPPAPPATEDDFWEGDGLEL